MKIAVAAALSLNASALANGEFRFTSGLGLTVPAPRAASRTMARVDPVELSIVRGQWKAPAAGDTLAGGTWTAMQAGGDGAFTGGDGSPLAGGWVRCTYEAEADGVMMLDAQGHGSVFVNGEPRGGDPYSWGFVQVPVAVRRGSNEFLFSVGRGSLRARLVAPPAAAFVSPTDMIVPSLVAGRDNEGPVGVVVVNASNEPLRGARIALSCDLPGDDGWVDLHSMPPLTAKKVSVPARFRASSVPAPGRKVSAALLLADAAGKPIGGANVEFASVASTDRRTVTRESTIDGSVQYYAVVPSTADRAKGDPMPGILYSVHGAGVEATGQAACYAPKREAHVVCPTNRRPFGFDWEDWGRTDFAEAFAHARATLVSDPLRSWLTGHSMGGHGTWQLGAHFPGEFAAIAPSAGWISFSSYTGANAAGGTGAAPADPAVDMLLRSGRASDTLALKENYLQQGVYVLHGDADDNVPVTEAREMFRQMAAMHHPDFAYHERCGAGHWWGNECVDWPPLTDFLFRHSLPKPESNAVVRFRTVAPQVSARSAWVRVLQQERPFEVSGVDAALDVAKREVTVTTSNVVRLDLVPPVAGGAPVKVTVDGTAIDAPAADKVHLRLVHAAGADGKPSWTLAASQPGAREKKPARGGPFKNAFAHGFVAVVGTQGDDAADALLMAKARYDSDQWWVRGNGRFEILTDRAFDPAEYKGRNVVLYGNHDQHADWDALVGATAGVDVRDGTLAGPTGRHQGDDLAAMFVLPRADCDQGQVGVIAATGATGLRAAMRTPVFTAGVGIPDLVAFRADMLEKGTGGIVEAGFFGNDWSVAGGTWMRR
jgi:hypothetical protein